MKEFEKWANRLIIELPEDKIGNPHYEGAEDGWKAALEWALTKLTSEGEEIDWELRD